MYLDVAVSKDKAKPYTDKGKGIVETAERRKRRGKPLPATSHKLTKDITNVGAQKRDAEGTALSYLRITFSLSFQLT